MAPPNPILTPGHAPVPPMASTSVPALGPAPASVQARGPAPVPAQGPAPAFRVIIPARHGATRLPGKPLLTIDGKPLIQMVFEQANRTSAMEILVATDDERIAAACRAFGAPVVMTRADHPSGSDRLAEVIRRLGWPGETLVVNLQGDEPCMPPALVDQVAASLAAHSGVGMATLAYPISDAETLFDPGSGPLFLPRPHPLAPAGLRRRPALPAAGDDLSASHRALRLPRGISPALCRLAAGAAGTGGIPGAVARPLAGGGHPGRHRRSASRPRGGYGGGLAAGEGLSGAGVRRPKVQTREPPHACRRYSQMPPEPSQPAGNGRASGVVWSALAPVGGYYNHERTTMRSIYGLSAASLLTMLCVGTVSAAGGSGGSSPYPQMPQMPGFGAPGMNFPGGGGGAPPPASGAGAPNAPAYAAPSASGYAPPPAFGNAPPTAPGYAPPPASGYAPPPAQGYPPPKQPPQAPASVPPGAPPAGYGAPPGMPSAAGAYPPGAAPYPPAGQGYPPGAPPGYPAAPPGYPPPAEAPGAPPVSGAPAAHGAAPPPSGYPPPGAAYGAPPGYPPPPGSPGEEPKGEDGKGKGGFNPMNMMNKMPNPMNMFGGNKD